MLRGLSCTCSKRGLCSRCGRESKSQKATSFPIVPVSAFYTSIFAHSNMSVHDTTHGVFFCRGKWQNGWWRTVLVSGKVRDTRAD